jgi:hypothetical protein
MTAGFGVAFECGAGAVAQRRAQLQRQSGDDFEAGGTMLFHDEEMGSAAHDA